MTLGRGESWDYRHGEIDVLNRMNVPKKIRQDPVARAKIMEVLQPGSLRRCMDDLSSEAPLMLAPYVREICAYSPPGSPMVEAFATAPAAKARVITVAQGLMWLIMTGVALFEELQAPIRESAADVLKGRPKAVVEPDTALELMSLLAGEIQHDWSTTGRATELVQLMVESHNDPEGLRSAFRAITSGEPPTALTHALIDSTLRFVVAHEVAHHLLGHTAPLGPERPGPTFLEAETTRIGLSPHPVHLSTAHAEEFSADEMGFILSSADLTSGSPTDLYAKAVITVTGAFIALPALALIDERPPEAVSNSSQSHPALGARGARLGELAIRWCPPNPHRPVLQPTINREIDGHPASAALLSWLVIAVVARRLAELGGTSDAD